LEELLVFLGSHDRQTCAKKVKCFHLGFPVKVKATCIFSSFIPELVENSGHEKPCKDTAGYYKGLMKTW